MAEAASEDHRIFLRSPRQFTQLRIVFSRLESDDILTLGRDPSARSGRVPLDGLAVLRARCPPLCIHNSFSIGGHPSLVTNLQQVDFVHPC